MRSMLRVSRFIAVVVFALACASSRSVRAEDFAGDVPDLVMIDVGGAYNDVSTDITVRGPNGIGAAINLEDVFDMPGTKTTARMLGTVRISPKRRHIDFGYVDISRIGSRQLTADVDFADYRFHAGSDVAAKFGTQFFYAAFRYDFLHEEKVRISGSAGLTWLQLKARLATNGLVTHEPDGAVESGFFTKQVSQGAPVPMVGLNLDWALTKRLVLRTYARMFRINLDAVNGGLYDNGIHLNWYFARKFGMGLGVDRTDLKLKELKLGNENIMKAEYAVNGIGVYFNMAF